MTIGSNSYGQAKTAARWELAAVLVLPLLWVTIFLHSGLPNLADGQIHLFRAVEWDYLWRNGVMLPTWAPNLAFGYGYPLFNFAPPLPYVAIDAWHLLGLSFTDATKLLSISILYLSCLGTYFFARRTLGFAPSLLAAAAQIYTPFVFRQHLLYGGNYPQLLGMALFPWGLWALQRVLAGERRSAPVWLAVIVAAGLLSHLFQGLLLVALLIFYIIVWQIRHLFSRQTIHAIGCLLLGVGLAAYFLLPVFIERTWTWGQSAYYLQKSPIALRFLSLEDLWAWPARLDQSAANPWVPFSLGPILLALAGLGLLVLPWQRQRIGFIKQSLFCVLVLSGIVFLMLPESEILWKTFSFLSLAQFPWRLFGLAILAAAYLAGAGAQALVDWMAKIGARASLQAGMLIALLSLIIASVAPLAYPTAPFADFGNPTIADHLRLELSGLVIGGTNLGEYTPQWAEKQPTDSPLVPEMLADREPERLDRSSLPPQTEVTPISYSPLAFRYQLLLPEAQPVRFFLFYFPGWTARIDDVPAPVYPEQASGLLLVDVPSGEHRLEIAYRLPPYRWAALVLTFCSIVILFVMSRRGKSAIQYIRDDVQTTPQAQSALIFLLLLIGLKLGLRDQLPGWMRFQSPAGTVLAAQQQTDIVFGDTIRLLGFDAPDRVYRPGQRMHVRLYWQALRPLETDFTTFVHLDSLPPIETRATSDNEAPGDAQAQIDIPTHTWTPDTYVRDEHRFSLPPDMPPQIYQVRVGLYNPKSGERLSPSVENGDVIATVYIVGDPPESPSVRAQRTKIGDSIELRGYGFAGKTATEITCSAANMDECLPPVTLYWRTDKPIAENLTVLLHLIGPDGALYGQGDGPPLGGRYSTSLWLPNQTIADSHILQTETTLPPGEYHLLAGLYHPENGERLPAMGKDGLLPQGAVPLTGLHLIIVE